MAENIMLIMNMNYEVIQRIIIAIFKSIGVCEKICRELRKANLKNNSMKILYCKIL